MTRLIVLGVLDMKPMSGYDIQQALRSNDAERWAGVLIGSIYHALKKLEQEDYIEIDSIEQTGHRQKAIYKITKSGKNYLKELVLESLKESSVLYPSTLYSGISFIHQISNEESQESLLFQKIRLEEEKSEIKKGLIEKKRALGDALSPLTELIFENMFSIIELQKEFLDKALKIIK